MKEKMRSLFGILGIAFLLLGSVTTPVFARNASHADTHLAGGQVLPPQARPHGFSLANAAKATAAFNVGPRTPDTLPENFPFQILYLTSDMTFTVDTGTMLYVPVLYSSDIDAALWPFPDVTDPQAVMNYYFDSGQLGAEYMHIIVDGRLSDLGPAYAVGAVTPGLPDGSNNYTVAAAFLTPLTKGTHTVTIEGLFSGADIALYPDYFPGGVLEFHDLAYTVIVK